LHLDCCTQLEGSHLAVLANATSLTSLALTNCERLEDDSVRKFQDALTFVLA
jgi:hypothetical protein